PTASSLRHRRVALGFRRRESRSTRRIRGELPVLGAGARAVARRTLSPNDVVRARRRLAVPRRNDLRRVPRRNRSSTPTTNVLLRDLRATPRPLQATPAARNERPAPVLHVGSGRASGNGTD